MREQPTIYFITGPIGVGKSTCIVSFMKRLNMEKIDYISSDLYYYLYFKENNDNESNNYKKAKTLRDYKIDKAINQRKSFIWESVFDDKKISKMESFANQGYRLIGLFVGTDDSESLLKRVKERSIENWYDVPEEKMKSRYRMMMGSLQRLSSASNILILIDSGLNGFRVVCYLYNDNIELKDETCTWAKRFFDEVHQ